MAAASSSKKGGLLKKLLLSLLLIVIGVPALAFGVATYKFGKLRGRTVEIPTNVGFAPIEGSGAELAAEAERLYITRGCADCHGADGAGKVFIDDPGLGRFTGVNITHGAGGRAADHSIEQFDAAVRHCVGADGHPLFIMPCRDYTHLADHDLALIWHHVQSLAPVDASPEQAFKPLGTFLVGMGLMPAHDYDTINHNDPRVVAPPVGATVEYGRYMAGACVGCHGANFSGGPLPGAPPSLPVPQNLTQHATGLEGWTYEQFSTAVRTGVRPDGTTINPFMPAASSFGHFTETETQALWAFMSSLPPMEEGNR